MPQVVITCTDLTIAIDFYTESLGFRLETIMPADSPRTAILSGFGIKVSLLQEKSKPEVLADIPLENLRPAVTPIDEGDFKEGRAHMRYRDLVPDRFGGRLIASHIRIPNGGPVPDHVHHHNIFFQMIFCINGWVKVVYEDQGQPFVIQAGDCLLQPPHIRHQVLECSEMMEVVEIACPAEHETSIDHEIRLPTERFLPNREFGGQKFVLHEAKHASWVPSDCHSFEYCDTGIEEATRGKAAAVVIRNSGESEGIRLPQVKGIRFFFVLNGTTNFTSQRKEQLSTGDTCTMPPGHSGMWSHMSDDFEYLAVTVFTP